MRCESFFGDCASPSFKTHELAASFERNNVTASPPPPPVFPVGAHVALFGPTHAQWRGRRGVCLGATEAGAMRVVVDADQGVIVEVGAEELVGVARRNGDNSRSA